MQGTDGGQEEKRKGVRIPRVVFVYLFVCFVETEEMKQKSHNADASGRTLGDGMQRQRGAWHTAPRVSLLKSP